MLWKKNFVLGVCVLTVVVTAISVQAESFGVIHDQPEMTNQAAVSVQEENEGQELPVIVQWQDGHGYQEDGTPIAGSWAYDSVNPAGKYVLFGEDGAVVRKSESMGESGIGEDYTGTEMVPAVIALRAKTFKGFHGTVSVLLEEKSGLQKRVELNAGNFYSLNISVNSGDYVLRQVEAKEQETYYKVKFSTDAVYVPEQGMRMMKIRVKNKKLETKEVSVTERGTEAGNTQEQMTEDNEKQCGLQTEQQERQEGKEERMQDMSLKKVMALFGSIGTICMAGVFLLRRKRRRHR